MRIPTRLLNIILLALASVVVILTLYVTHRQARRLETEEKHKINLWAEATRRAVDLNSPQQDYEFILQVIERNETVPVVLTNSALRPISMRNIDESLLGDEKRLLALIERFAEENPPIPIVFPSGASLLSFGTAWFNFGYSAFRLPSFTLFASFGTEQCMGGYGTGDCTSVRHAYILSCCLARALGLGRHGSN